MKGRLIVIEGLDGCGKATQSGLLFEELKDMGMEPEKLTFPDYDSLSSGPVRMYLSGQLGEEPDETGPYAASVLYAVDRFCSYKADWKKKYEEGKTFVCDRYTTSNGVFQTSKLKDEERDKYLEWLESFEYGLMGIPRPDIVLFLNMSEDTSAKLMEKRYSGDESKKDIHEKDRDFQHRSRMSALYCAQKLGWIKVDCDAEGELLPVEAIHQKIMSALKEKGII